MERGRPPRRPTRGADLALRGVGLALVLIAASAMKALLDRAHVDIAFHDEPISYLLAAIAFLGASLGSGLLVLGGHIHDRVAISPLWRPYSDLDAERPAHEDGFAGHRVRPRDEIRIGTDRQERIDA